ncbi:MAG: L-2-amino-thiazoline-4-carboxylic acid hydrolase [Spirochaetes bacterium]|nr:L-2-amino-thiazoline-4-carboxylic acid hydrolase [Spirochaetota bacterium]
MADQEEWISKKEYLQDIFEVRLVAFRDRVNDLNALKEEFGEKVVDIVLQSRAKRMQKTWQSIAAEEGRNDIEGLKQTLWTWVKEAGFEYHYEEKEEGTQFTVTYCPLAEMAKKIDAADWGYHCYCADDEHIVAGFNPEMSFKRTKTLMEGHDCCDHFYSIKKK